MSDDKLHRTLLESYYTLVDGHHLEELLRLFHKGVVYERYGHPVIRGLDALRNFYLHDRQIADGVHSIDVIIAQGNWAVAKGQFTGSLRDGTEVSVRFADFHHFRSGRIWRRYTFFGGNPI